MACRFPERSAHIAIPAIAPAEIGATMTSTMDASWMLKNDTVVQELHRSNLASQSQQSSLVKCSAILNPAGHAEPRRFCLCLTRNPWYPAAHSPGYSPGELFQLFFSSSKVSTQMRLCPDVDPPEVLKHPNL